MKSKAFEANRDSHDYAVFEGGEDYRGLRNAGPVGTPAPDFTAILSGSGQPVKLND